MLAAYTRWCDERARVTDAYRDWADSNAVEDADAWQAYELALDHAETAYIRYVLLTERAAVCDSQPDSAARVETKAWRLRPTRRGMIGT